MRAQQMLAQHSMTYTEIGCCTWMPPVHSQAEKARRQREVPVGCADGGLVGSSK